MTKADIEAAALKPCPFCGKPPGSKVGPPALARCITDGCHGKSLGAVTTEEWNRRPAASGDLRTAIAAYNKVWNDWIGLDASNVDKCRAEAMTAALASLPGRDDEAIRAEPTPVQVNSACMSYRHDFGLLPESERSRVQFEAREWLHAWQKEGIGANRNEIIERCAAEVDQANREGPYQAIAAASQIRSLKTERGS